MVPTVPRSWLANWPSRSTTPLCWATRTGCGNGRPARRTTAAAQADLMDSRTISDAVSGRGWRYLLGALRTSVAVTSLTEAVAVAAHAAAAAGDEGGHLSLDLRPDRVFLTAQSPETASVTPRDIDLARRLYEAVGDGGQRTDPGVGDPQPRSVQTHEIAFYAVDIPSVRRFWKGSTRIRGRARPTGGKRSLRHHLARPRLQSRLPDGVIGVAGGRGTRERRSARDRPAVGHGW